MQSVVVAVGWLRAQLEKNLAEHVKEYQLALTGFQNEMEAKLLAAVDEIRKNPADFNTYKLVQLPMPKSHEREYRRVLKMLDASSSDEVELQNHEFAQYVEDDWDWKEQWKASNSSYMGK